MNRSDRLARLVVLMRDSGGMTAEDLARETGVTLRTIYRDMDSLRAAGIPILGRAGHGYRITAEVTLPPLNLGYEELEALHLGLAAVAQGGDPGMAAAARRLAERIDAALPEDEPDSPAGLPPFGTADRGAQHQAALRQAIRARQKLALTAGGARRTVRPLRLDYWGRIWTCVVWDETGGDFAELRLDQIAAVEVLPHLFVPEPGRTLADFDARRR